MLNVALVTCLRGQNMSWLWNSVSCGAGIVITSAGIIITGWLTWWTHHLSNRVIEDTEGHRKLRYRKIMRKLEDIQRGTP